MRAFVRAGASEFVSMREREREREREQVCLDTCSSVTAFCNMSIDEVRAGEGRES